MEESLKTNVISAKHRQAWYEKSSQKKGGKIEIPKIPAAKPSGRAENRATLAKNTKKKKCITAWEKKRTEKPLRL